jgi:hypothetical protein
MVNVTTQITPVLTVPAERKIQNVFIPWTTANQLNKLVDARLKT